MSSYYSVRCDGALPALRQGEMSSLFWFVVRLAFAFPVELFRSQPAAPPRHPSVTPLLRNTPALRRRWYRPPGTAPRRGGRGWDGGSATSGSAPLSPRRWYIPGPSGCRRRSRCNLGPPPPAPAVVVEAAIAPVRQRRRRRLSRSSSLIRARRSLRQCMPEL